MILRALRWLFGAVAILLSAVVLYVGIAFGLGALPVNSDFQPAPDGTKIVVCSNGIHTDFVLPVQTSEVNWFDQFPPDDFEAPVAAFDHVGIGWGDFDFYRATPTWDDFSTATALKALTGLGPAALHVQYRAGPGPAEDCRRLVLDGATDLFYPAQGHFSLIKTCNVWLGQGLRASGLPAGLWTPFSFQVLSHL